MPSRGNLAEQIGRRIDAAEPAWFPGLARELIARFWTTQRHLKAGDYSTASWLREPKGHQATLVPGCLAMAIEPLPPSLARRFDAPAFDAVADRAARAVSVSLARLNVSAADAAVTTLVRSIHCVAAKGAGYDCSHSEPDIPFSVLVSIPFGERHAELRLAESILHEAMHLQLTLIELNAPIIGTEIETGYSPWQQRVRPIQGLFHGLYVFVAIHQWLRKVAGETGLSAEDQRYVQRRLGEISEEISAISGLAAAAGLTDFGRQLAVWLFRRFEPASLSVVYDAKLIGQAATVVSSGR